MAPGRVSAVTYSTRRKKQLPVSRSSSTSPDVVGTTTCSPDVRYPNGCELLSTHDDADDILRNEFLAEKEEAEYGKQDYNTNTSSRLTPFPRHSALCPTAATESSTESTPVSVRIEQGEMIFQRLRTTPLLCARRALESGDSLETTPRERSTQGGPPDRSTTKSPSGEGTHQWEASPKLSDNQMDFSAFLKKELSAQKTDTYSNETPLDETEKYVCDPVLPAGVEEKAVPDRKGSPDLHESSVAVLRVNIGKDIERQLSTTVPDELLEVAGSLDDGPCASKRRRCSALPRTPVRGGRFSEGSVVDTPPSLVGLQGGAPGGECTENSTLDCTFSDGILDTSTGEAGTVCQPVTAKDVASKEEDPVRPSLKPKPQQTPAKRLSAVSPPAAHVETFATPAAEDVVPNQESRTVVQQNTTTIIKRRRCGSLGLDQSLRWQAMARRVPRIKGVCYSTTRHEWIAVGPLQAGSARKKNIYFSVPKYGFDGARRLAVECRRRLQAGVPVNVQEFVREQQLLFQGEATANEPAEGATFVPDAGSLTEKISSEDNRQTTSSPARGAPQSLSRKLSASARAPLDGAASQAQGCHPENPSTPASNVRRRRPRALTLGPLQRDIAQGLLQEEGGIDEAPEDSKNQVATRMQSDLEAGDPSQIGFLKPRWQGYFTKENSRQVQAVSKHRAPRESNISTLARDERISGETPARSRPTDGSGTSAKQVTDNADVSVDVDGLDGSPTCGKGAYLFEREGIVERASSSDESAFSISARLAIMARQRALNSDELARAAALLSSDAFMAQSGYTWATGRALQLWASALNHTTHVDGQTTEHSKLCTESGITSTLPAAFTTANGGKICSSKDVCTTLPPAILRSISFSRRTAAAPPPVHLPLQRPGYARTEGCNGKGGLKQHQHAPFLANDYYGRRSSTTSSAGSRSAGVLSFSETNCENPEHTHAAKESSDDSDPEKHSRKPCRRKSFCEDVLQTGKASQFEHERLRKKKCTETENRRFSAALAMSLSSENADTSRETAATDVVCSPSNSRRSLVDLLDPAETLTSEDGTDPRRSRVCAVEDGPALLTNPDSTQAVHVRERTDSAVTPTAAYSPALEARAISKDNQEESPSPSLSLGNAFSYAATLDCPVSSDDSCPSSFLSRSEQTSGVSHTAFSRCSFLQEIEKTNFSDHELDVPVVTNGLPGDSDMGMPIPHGGSGACALARDKEDESGERESGDEQLTAKQTVAVEISPLVKALCLMLVDLLRFCSCNPVALARTGLQPSQILFCINDGVRVLRTALQDVSATRTVSPRFRAYLEVFEDSILANVLPTSGGTAEIICYLYRLKHITEGRGPRPGHADNDKPTEDTCGGPKNGGGAAQLKRSHESCTARDNPDTNEHSAVRRSNRPTYERRKCPTGNEALATSLPAEELDGPSSLPAQGGELARGNGKASNVKDAVADVKGLLNSPAARAVPSWPLTQRHTDAELEQRRSAREEALSGQRVGTFECRSVEAYKESSLTACLSSSSVANIFATNDATTGVQNSKKRRTTDCPASPDPARGERAPIGRPVDSTCEIISSSNKTQRSNGETPCNEETYTLLATLRVSGALPSRSTRFF